MTNSVCLTFDFDAISSWIAKDMTTPGPISRGEFGAHAVPRILSLLDKYEIMSTFFIPGHTIESYTHECQMIHSRGHEIGLHGYVHEFVSTLTRDEEFEINRRSSALIAELTGFNPVGHRSPSFDFSESTAEILESLGIVYDSSLMGTDYSPYLLRKADRWNCERGFQFGQKTKVIELPVAWTLDDHPHLEYLRGPGYVLPGLRDPFAMFNSFYGDVRWMQENLNNSFVNITLHPQVIGRGNRLLALEQFILDCKALNVEFERCAEVAEVARAKLGTR
ncbi:polysaccharide deacetylase family protein [Brevibacterium zhoupengii]|uniref:polysaccharide deacetylase family protein n=1 Tax=Brevibacterium zhoupengii TaxID=2898795 RepID=UPI001E31A922|nr:polysaccharide deacetylase [Brevibacterium zhoupengii]